MFKTNSIVQDEQLLLTGGVGGIAQRAIFGNEPFIVMLGMFAVCAIQGICHCTQARRTEGIGEHLIVKLSDHSILDYARLGNDLDLDTEVEEGPCHKFISIPFP